MGRQRQHPPVPRATRASWRRGTRAVGICDESASSPSAASEPCCLCHAVGSRRTLRSVELGNDRFPTVVRHAEYLEARSVVALRWSSPAIIMRVDEWRAVLDARIDTLGEAGIAERLEFVRSHHEGALARGHAGCFRLDQSHALRCARPKGGSEWCEARSVRHFWLHAPWRSKAWSGLLAASATSAWTSANARAARSLLRRHPRPSCPARARSSPTTGHRHTRTLPRSWRNPGARAAASRPGSPSSCATQLPLPSRSSTAAARSPPHGCSWCRRSAWQKVQARRATFSW